MRTDAFNWCATIRSSPVSTTPAHTMDRRRTLDDLEGAAWGPATYDSYLVERCRALRTVPSAIAS